MRSFHIAALVCMAVAPAHVAAGQVPNFTELAGLVQKTKEATGHPSATAIAVIKDGRIVYEGYFGYADIQKGVPADRDTVFYIASATKPFVALNTLIMEERGALDTDRSLRDLFPQASFTGFDAGAVTIRHLLTHTSGVDNQPLVWATAFSGIHDPETRHALVVQSYPDKLANHGAFRYTNVGYNILSVWLDSSTGKPWQQQLEANIFAPLGMTHTTAYVSEARKAGWQLAKPYSVQSVNRNEPLYLEKADETMQAAGGLLASAPDLAQFLIAQLTLGAPSDKQLLPESVVRKSQVQQTATDGTGYQDFSRSGYAWGWYVGEYKGRVMLHHFGGFAGFHAHLSFIPEENAGLVVLSNEDFLAARVTNLIADHAYGLTLGEAGINDKSAARFAELLKMASQLEAAVTKQRQEIQAREWRLTLPVQAYLGTYTHRLLGEVVVRPGSDGNPTLEWGRLRARATAYDKQDHARVEFVPNSGRVVEFVVNDGRVETIVFEDMRFDKVE